MPKKVNLDTLLTEAATFRVDQEADPVDVESVPVPEALHNRVLAQAKLETGRLLAGAILDSAAEKGETKEKLLRESEDRDAVSELLEGQGDPRRVGSQTLARLFGIAGVDPHELRDLIAQAVVQFVVIEPGSKRPIWLRSFAKARSAPGPERTNQTARAREAGLAFADEVIAEWQSLDQKPRAEVAPDEA